jgi:PAS domain S-box-containing protein
MTAKKTYEELEKNILKMEKTIYQLRKSEIILKDEITRLNLLLLQARDGIVILNENGKVYQTSKQFATMLGYSVEEIYNMYVWDWDYLHTKEHLDIMLQTISSSGDHFETKHRCKDGHIIDVEISTNGTNYKGKKLILCICRDITERKKTEKELLKLNKKITELKSELKRKVPPEAN